MRVRPARMPRTNSLSGRGNQLDWRVEGAFTSETGGDMGAPLMSRCVESPPHQKQGDNAYAGDDNRAARGAATASNATPVSTRGAADDDQRQQGYHVQPSKPGWTLEH
ncbi:hypothetical protein JIQ42_06221 [Leishmania sp. Namibia]|uniref:hypothetical protein n=1 Tax=Leishmania sp. Namibia TaxID=2802991 RepID=UPI001B756E28|nr:hypothetical protein JIQ42_06221 [Leishmania sp. Namibia]